ncbi:MAG: DUF262 domain-containing protein [Candidatus Diapherotrites archaeon]
MAIGQPTQQRITWFYQRDKEGALELAPPFQRKPVWSMKNKSFLIDTIIQQLPIPEIYMQIKTDKDGKTKYVVVDGQQRLRAILEFLEGEFSILSDDNPTHGDKEFKELPDGVKKDIWDYALVVRELENTTDEGIRGIFTRLNKNVVPLNRQELRNARFVGEFIKLMTELSEDTYWAENRVVSPSDIRRMLDVEFISDLFITTIHGIQDKNSDTLDNFYKMYDAQFQDKEPREKQFRKTLTIIDDILGDLKPTRWHYKNDFYSLFVVISELINEYQFPTERYPLIKDSLNTFISEVDLKGTKSTQSLIKEYSEASEAHTTNQSQRKKRVNVIRQLIIPFLIAKDHKRNFTEEERRIFWNMAKEKKCALCKDEVKWAEYELDHITPHTKSGKTELQNAQITHKKCNASKGAK